VEIGKLDVEQDDVRVQLVSGGNGGLTVFRLADDVVSLRLQQRVRSRTEARVVVDDQNCCHVSKRATVHGSRRYGYPHSFPRSPPAKRGRSTTRSAAASEAGGTAAAGRRSASNARSGRTSRGPGGSRGFPPSVTSPRRRRSRRRGPRCR